MPNRTTIARTLAIVWAMSLGLNFSASAQLTTTSQPAADIKTIAAERVLEQREIGASSSGTANLNGPTTGESSLSTPTHSIGFDLGRMAVALAIVIGVIFGIRWLLTHFFAAARAPATHRAIKVLGRMSFGPRQQVSLLQVGRRVIVVGESNGQLSPLAQLDDPDEVAGLIGQLQEEQSQRAASFGGLFGRVQNRFAHEDERDEHSAREPTDTDVHGSEPSLEPANDSQAKSELAGLVDKVRSIRDQLGRQ